MWQSQTFTTIDTSEGGVLLILVSSNKVTYSFSQEAMNVKAYW